LTVQGLSPCQTLSLVGCSLPSTGITRLQRYCEPLRIPKAPGLSLAGVRLIIPDHAFGGCAAGLRQVGGTCNRVEDVTWQCAGSPSDCPRCGSPIGRRRDEPRDGRRLQITDFPFGRRWLPKTSSSLEPRPNGNLPLRKDRPRQFLNSWTTGVGGERIRYWWGTSSVPLPN
jgi:hypothetical protein